MEFIAEYSLFLLKVITVAIAILIVVMGVFGISMRNKLSGGRDEHLEITSLNDMYTDMHAVLEEALLSPQQLKLLAKDKKKQDKVDAKLAKKKAKEKAKEKRGEEAKGTANKAVNDEGDGSDKGDEGDGNDGGDGNGGDDGDDDYKKRLYVLDFDGDIKASAVAELRQEITATLTMATAKDEVLVRIESGGGEVHSYGLAASQLQRLRDHKIPLTVSVDKVAASGGYLMACVADKIIAAPFAILGSIGVIAQIPNVHKILKKHDVDIEQLTAGEYKRTLTLLGKNTDKARAKMQQELEEVHDSFKDFVIKRRPQVKIKKVATGEHWLGNKALELNLVDQLLTSDDYIMAQRETADILELKIKKRKNLVERITSGAVKLFNRTQTQASETQYPRLM